jgi:hypothetical protein
VSQHNRGWACQATLDENYNVEFESDSERRSGEEVDNLWGTHRCTATHATTEFSIGIERGTRDRSQLGNGEQNGDSSFVGFEKRWRQSAPAASAPESKASNRLAKDSRVGICRIGYNNHSNTQSAIYGYLAYPSSIYRFCHRDYQSAGLNVA